jgi:hypothetical protein
MVVDVGVLYPAQFRIPDLFPSSLINEQSSCPVVVVGMDACVVVDGVTGIDVAVVPGELFLLSEFATVPDDADSVGVDSGIFPCDSTEGCDGINGIVIALLPCSICGGGVIVVVVGTGCGVFPSSPDALFSVVNITFPESPSQKYGNSPVFVSV